MENEANIAQVSVKNSDTDYDLITLHEFLKKAASERTELVMQKRVEFINYKGGKIPTLDALKSITALIKKLREEGKFFTSIT
jgi:hypothetical protein